MDQNRKSWNGRQKELRHSLEKSSDTALATELFLLQHAAVHVSRISNSPVHSFADEVLRDLSPNELRFIPRKENHSIAWVVWHLARVEDVTMNLLVANEDQVLLGEDWPDRLGIDEIHTGNGMTDHDVVRFSSEVDISALVKYRLSVGLQTCRIVKKLKAANYSQKVQYDRIQRIWDEAAMLPKAKGIVEYWAGRTIAGLLLMPPTRHCIIHLNEARRIKSKAARHKSE